MSLRGFHSWPSYSFVKYRRRSRILARRELCSKLLLHLSKSRKNCTLNVTSMSGKDLPVLLLGKYFRCEYPTIYQHIIYDMKFLFLIKKYPNQSLKPPLRSRLNMFDVCSLSVVDCGVFAVKVKISIIQHNGIEFGAFSGRPCGATMVVGFIIAHLCTHIQQCKRKFRIRMVMASCQLPEKIFPPGCLRSQKRF